MTVPVMARQGWHWRGILQCHAITAALISDEHAGHSGQPLQQRPENCRFVPKLATPLPNRFVGDNDGAGEQEFCPIAEAETGAEGEAGAVADELKRKSVILVSGG
jgi:hypothetical protein